MEAYEIRARRRAERRAERERRETVAEFAAGAAFVFAVWLLFYVTGALLRMA